MYVTDKKTRSNHGKTDHATNGKLMNVKESYHIYKINNKLLGEQKTELALQINTI
jgi:hypothetical protein